MATGKIICHDQLTISRTDPFTLHIHLQTRRVLFAGCSAQPDAAWIERVTRKALQRTAALRAARYLLRDRDGKYAPAFDRVLKTAGIEAVVLPPRSPNLNAHSERFVRSVKEECLDHLILLGEGSLRRALQAYAEYYHHERNHQGIGNAIPFPKASNPARAGPIRKRSRLGGLLNCYFRQAA